jgi:3D (Asp-Asp-Asp) domain-containing protein
MRSKILAILLIGVMAIGLFSYILFACHWFADPVVSRENRKPIRQVEAKMDKAVAKVERRHTEQSRQEAAKVLTMTATAYSEHGPCKYKEIPAGPGKVAVDPRVIPLGTKLHIEGYGHAVAVDTGKFIKGKRVDVWIASRGDAIRWGRRKVRVTVYGK